MRIWWVYYRGGDNNRVKTVRASSKKAAIELVKATGATDVNLVLTPPPGQEGSEVVELEEVPAA